MSKLVKWSLLARQSDFNLEKLIEISGVSRKQVTRRCQHELGRPPGQWIAEQRLFAAEWLLREKSIKEVAYELHFKQVSHFSRCFKAFFGITPAKAKRRIKWSP